MAQPAQLTLGDRVLADLERQISEPDPRYAQKCRELAIVRAQYAELAEFVRSKADVLGMTETVPSGQESAEAVAAPAAPVNGKPLPKEPTKSAT